MSKTTRYLLAMLLVIVLGCFLQWKFCCNCDKTTCSKNNKTDNTVATPVQVSKEATNFPFAIKDTDGNLSLNVNDNFNFQSSSFSYEMPLTQALDSGVVNVKNYMLSNEGKGLDITGFYTKDEKNSSLFPNLGLARANAVKSYFEKKGIPSKMINIFGELKEGLIPNDKNIYLGPLAYKIHTAKDNSDELAKLLADIQVNPLVLYFKTGEASINLTAAQRTKIANISRYLDKVEGAKASVIGHTDNKGNADFNVKLGQERADFAKGHLVKNGISAQKIETSSKGPYKPIDTNDTAEGRAKNRRTVITIK